MTTRGSSASVCTPPDRRLRKPSMRLTGWVVIVKSRNESSEFPPKLSITKEINMSKFVVLGGFYGSDEEYDVIALADTFEDAEVLIALYQQEEAVIVEYDFYTIDTVKDQ
jgi:hypothetical protein